MLKINFKLTSIAVLIATILTGCATAPKRESTGQYLDNSAITLKVKSQLLADPDVKSYPITVNTYKGVVQLSGFVDTYTQERKAVQIARSVPGVAGVDDALVVKPH